MSSAEDLRSYALSLPEVEEATHFGMPSFKVKGKSFAGLEKDGLHGGVSVPLETARAFVAEDPSVYELVWRSGEIFVGLRIDLPRAAPHPRPRTC
jgi:hypothetical protein